MSLMVSDSLSVYLHKSRSFCPTDAPDISNIWICLLFMLTCMVLKVWRYLDLGVHRYHTEGEGIFLFNFDFQTLYYFCKQGHKYVPVCCLF